jgi:hypothetical protein
MGTRGRGGRSYGATGATEATGVEEAHYRTQPAVPSYSSLITHPSNSPQFPLSQRPYIPSYATTTSPHTASMSAVMRYGLTK